jgi:galactose-1-phosphate uridylyltransferase
VGELGRGISRVLSVYAALGFESFNLALYGMPAGRPLELRLVARAYYGAALRSDAMWSERLHWEAAVDVTPERVAELAREVWD